MDGVAGELYKRTKERGVTMVDRDEREGFLIQLLLAYFTDPVAESAEQLQCLVRDLGSVCAIRKKGMDMKKKKTFWIAPMYNLICMVRTKRM